MDFYEIPLLVDKLQMNTHIPMPCYDNLFTVSLSHLRLVIA